jgi:predicted enzyme related to lactoylglutathione lyase
MPSEPRNLTPMVHVADLGRSIAFYEGLGFQVENSFTPPDAPGPTWAWLEHGSARLMLTKATAPVVPEQQAVLFYLYYEDAVATHAELGAAGVAVGELSYPFYCPRGEFRVTDPDGYCLMLAHC